MTQRRAIDNQDLVVYAGLAGSFLLLMAARGGDFLKGIQSQALIQDNAKAALLDSAIAQSRFSQGCNTGFVMPDGSPNLIPGQPALDIANRTPIAPGALLCDGTGATGVIGVDGTVTDLRVSATVRRRFIEQGFSRANRQLQGVR